MFSEDLTQEQQQILFEAWAYCDWQDKSTEFMLEYMQDKAETSLDNVLEFIQNKPSERQDWYKNNPNWYDKYQQN